MHTAHCNCHFSCHAHPSPCMPPITHAPQHAHIPAMHDPLPCMPPCHAWPPPPCMPPAMHAPLATHVPHHICPLSLLCTPPAMHSPCHTYPPVDRILDIRLWKYYLAATLLRAVITINMHLCVYCIHYLCWSKCDYLASSNSIKAFPFYFPCNYTELNVSNWIDPDYCIQGHD